VAAGLLSVMLFPAIGLIALRGAGAAGVADEAEESQA
jgi:hypothetical protein